MKERWKRWGGILLLAFLALAWRLLFLNHQCFWMDEAFSTWMASHPLSLILKITRFSDAHPPLFYTLLHLWMKGGHSEVYLRIPSVVCGAVSTILLYLLAADLIGNPVAAYTAVFWAFSFVAVGAETQVRMYAPAITLSLASTYFFWKAYKQPSMWRWGLYVVFAALSLYTHYYTGFVIAAHGIFLVSRRRLKEAALVAAALVALFLPWIGAFFLQIELGQGRQLPSVSWGAFYGYFASMLGTRYFFTGLANNLVAGLSLALLALGGVRVVREKKEESLFPLLLFAIPCLVPFLINKLSPLHIFLFRYVPIFLPYFFLLLFLGLFAIPRVVRLPLFVALLFINIAMQYLFVTGQAFQIQNWRKTTEIVTASLEPGDAIFVEQGMSMFPLWYYMPSKVQIGWDGRDFVIGPPSAALKLRWYVMNKDTSFDFVGQAVRDSKRQWLILCQVYLVDPHFRLPRWFFDHLRMEKDYQLRSIEPADQIFLYLFHGSRSPVSKSDASAP